MSELDPTVTTPLAFPGEQLREARERHGISIDQVCNQLHLHAATVAAIEASDIDRLKDPVFTRGYIRAYANYLKLDPKPFVDAYNQATGQQTTSADVKAIGTVSMVPGRRQGHPVLKIGSWLFLLALIAVFVWWWQAQYGVNDNAGLSSLDEPVSVETTDGNTLVLPSVEEEEAPLPEVEPLVPDATGTGTTDTLSNQDEAPADGMTDTAAGSSEQAALEPEADTVSAEAANEEAAAGDVENPVQAAVEPDAPQGLVISLVDDCWLDIKASNGRSLYSGVAKAGTTLELEGEEPLAVVVGRVGAVEKFSYAGRTIDLAARSREGVARLSLPL
ncbi:RodZ domain-containing protein [Marinobacterium stanieri]|uniref:RodZ domain-containing protein n=1 Tax=Marinobacterium stanieri TaxID=49186 RepID=UPI000255A89E|nr:RodZ domain-containing protein [Marinobacterium stanieri]